MLLGHANHRAVPTTVRFLQDIPETANVSEELASPSETTPAADADAVMDRGGAGGGEGLGGGAAAGIGIAVTVGVLACLLCAVLLIRRRRMREREDEDTWKWYLYRGGDDDGASTRMVRSALFWCVIGASIALCDAGHQRTRCMTVYADMIAVW